MNFQGNKGCLVSVVMPAYNADVYIGEALESVFSQSYEAVEAIVVNDGSTDNTLKIVMEYREKYRDRLVVISQPNSGQTRAKNRGLKEAKGDFVAFLDSDDKWAPEKIEKQVELMEFRPELGLCYTKAWKIDELGNTFDYISPSPLLRGKCFEHLVLRNNIVASSVMVRRLVFEDVGYYDATLSAAENWDLWTRISKKYEIDYIDEPLTFYRVHSENMSKNFQKMYQARMYFINKHLPADSSDQWILGMRKKALFYAHVSFGKNYFEQPAFQKARKELLKAVRLYPTNKECYVLLFKTMLGRRLFGRLRSLRRR